MKTQVAGMAGVLAIGLTFLFPWVTYDGQLSEVTQQVRRGESVEAADVLLQQLRVHPTMKGFKTLMGLYIEQKTQHQSNDSLVLLKELVEEQIKQRPKYRCHSCGFSGSQIHWLCPSCKKWGMVKPIKGLDGE